MSRWGVLALLAGVVSGITACSSQQSAGYHRGPVTATPMPSPATAIDGQEAAGGTAGNASNGSNTSEIDVVSNGRTPVRITVTVNAADCSKPLDVHLTVALSRDSSPLPGGIDTTLARCGTYPEDLRPSAGPVHVAIHTQSTGNVSVGVSSSSGGSSINSSTTTVGGGSSAVNSSQIVTH